MDGLRTVGAGLMVFAVVGSLAGAGDSAIKLRVVGSGGKPSSAVMPPVRDRPPEEIGTHTGLIQATGPWSFSGGRNSETDGEPSTATAASATISLASDAASCEPLGSDVTVTATASGPRGSWVAGQLLVAWDPTKLALRQVRPGGDPYSVAYSLNQTAGSVMVLASIPPGTTPPSGGGVLTCDTSWARVATEAPGAYEIAYDSDRRRTVLVSDGKTWEWDGSSWSLRSAQGPPARGAGAMVYDPIGRRCLLFGGYGGNPVHSDLWSWDGATWTLLNSGQIPGRGDFAMAFDSHRNRLVVHGGYNLSFLMSDTCEWNPDTNTWSCIADGPIGRRYAHRMVYDPGLQRVMLHGGYYFFNRGDSWTWDGVSWVQISTTGPARYVFGMAYDSRRGEMVIHGGTTCCSEVEYPQTWRFRGGAWQLCGSAGPARGYMGMAYDSHRDALIFSGGMGPSPSGRIGYAETWELRSPVSDVQIAQLDFGVIGGSCDGSGTEVGFFNAGPLQTAFTDGLGNVIVPALAGSAGFVVDDGVPVLSNVPADVSVRPEAGEGAFAMVSLTAPTATDGCSPVTQTATRSDGQPLSAAYGVGTTTVTWRAVDPCGNEAVDFTSVTVEPFNTLDLSVSLAGGGFAPSLNRDLQLSVQGAGGTQARSVSALFSTGTASVSLTDLPIDAYGCITVEDTARSLRRRVNVTDGGATWTATASLVLGDIIDDEVIDVLDWGAYVVSNPNADLDGDGVITAADGQFILDNFGVQGDGVCGSPLDGPPTARESVSVAELVQMGLPELAGADLNGDGWLDLRDMAMAD